MRRELHSFHVNLCQGCCHVRRCTNLNLLKLVTPWCTKVALSKKNFGTCLIQNAGKWHFSTYWTTFVQFNSCTRIDFFHSQDNIVKAPCCNNTSLPLVLRYCPKLHLVGLGFQALKGGIISMEMGLYPPFSFNLKINGSLVARWGPKAWLNRSVAFKSRTIYRH